MPSTELGKALSSAEALKYERTLTSAINTNNEDIILFCKQFVYPNYCTLLEEAELAGNITVHELYKNIGK